MPAISIIVPVYKTEKHLSQCIESILAQTFTDFELILIDDGSPDNSGKICDEYEKKDSRIHVIHQKNAGVSSARNAGLDRAIGKYVMFCDSDDWVDPDWCQNMYLGITTNDVVMAICGYKSDGTTHKKVVDRDSKVTIQEWFGYYPQMCFVWDKILIREQIVKYNVYFPEDISFAEDTRFIMQYLRTNSSEDSFLLITNTLYNYRLIDDSLSRKYIKDFWKLENSLLEEIKFTSQLLNTNMDTYKEYMQHMCYFIVMRTIEYIFSTQNSGSISNKYINFKEVVNSEIYDKAIKAEDMNHFPKWYCFLLKHRVTLLLFIYNIFKK